MQRLSSWGSYWWCYCSWGSYWWCYCSQQTDLLLQLNHLDLRLQQLLLAAQPLQALLLLAALLLLEALLRLAALLLPEALQLPAALLREEQRLLDHRLQVSPLVYSLLQKKLQLLQLRTVR